MAMGAPLSGVFWESVERLLRRIEDSAVTQGEVREWLEATGSEPTQIIGLHVWEDEGVRGPLAERLHAELVDHLERLVLRGAIDPDRLLAGGTDARRAYVAEQERWLGEPFGGGQTRMDALFDEDDEEFIAAWDEADADALATLDGVLAEVGDRPRPDGALRHACDLLREELPEAGPPYDLLAAGGGVDPARLPADDEELWLVLATGVAAPRDELPEDQDVELLAAWYALEHADWLCAVGELVRRGPGAPAGDADLAGYVAASELVDSELDPDDADAIAFGFGFVQVVQLWRTLEAVNEDERLTALGWWGLPEAQRRAWTPAVR